MADEFDLPKGDLLRGKKGFVMGLADSHSIAFVIGAQLAAQGAQLAMQHIELNERRAKPLAEGLGAHTRRLRRHRRCVDGSGVRHR